MYPDALGDIPFISIWITRRTYQCYTGCAVLFQCYTFYHPNFLFETISYFASFVHVHHLPNSNANSINMIPTSNSCPFAPSKMRSYTLHLSSNPTTTTHSGCTHLQLRSFVLGAGPPPCPHHQSMNGVDGQYPRRCPITTK